MSIDHDEAATNTLDPLVPRSIDLPTPVPLDGSMPDADFDVAKVLAAPDDPAEWQAWRTEIERLAASARRRLAHDGSRYDSSPWTRDCRVAAQIWLWDERLWDAEARAFDARRLLAHYDDIGGLDALVLWHAYPVIGVDDRNQFDWYDVPGLDALVADLHAAGVRVFVDYNPWDVGTRREGVPDAAALRRVADGIGADGVFLDTLKHADDEFLSVMADGRPLVLEGESRVPNERLGDHLLSWAQWFADSDAPGVMRARLVERRHMLHSVRRWNRHHDAELQSSFMNGVGVLVWDAVFGVWVGWSARDRSTLRTMSRIQRAAHELLDRGEWLPLVGATEAAREAGVYASTWMLDGLTLVTLVNRSDVDATGALVDTSSIEGSSLWDVSAGRAADGGMITVPARGIAALVAVHGEDPEWLAPLVAAAAADRHDVDATFPARSIVQTPVPRSTGKPPEDAVVVEVGEHELTTLWRRRETGLRGEAPYVEEWKPLPPRLHDEQTLHDRVFVGGVAVAVREVSAAEHAAFCAATGRPHPADASEDAPATMLDLDDARAHAAWAGARLPTDAEWQLAAASPEFERRAPLVWSWTESETTDGVTRACVIKGGSERSVSGSDWYVDAGPQPPERAVRWLRTGLDASAAIGFRLAWDLDDEPGGGA